MMNSHFYLYLKTKHEDLYFSMRNEILREYFWKNLRNITWYKTITFAYSINKYLNTVLKIIFIARIFKKIFFINIIHLD